MARRLQLAALNAADGRLSYPKQFGRVRLFHAAKPANKPDRQRKRARVFSTDTDHGGKYTPGVGSYSTGCPSTSAVAGRLRKPVSGEADGAGRR
jgi:hypothetical protein